MFPFSKRITRPGKLTGNRGIVKPERWAATAGTGRRATFGLLLAAGGAGLAGRMFLRKRSAGRPGTGGITVERVVTVNRPAHELYGFWRDFTNLPRFMNHLASVSVLDDRHSHWVSRAPLGTRVEWDAEISDEQPDELLAWRSLPGSDVANDGSVRFSPAPAGRGTEVRVRLNYHPPAGPAGLAVAKLFGEEPDQQVREDLRRFKAVMEAGEAPTNDGQPSGRDD